MGKRTLLVERWLTAAALLATLIFTALVIGDVLIDVRGALVPVEVGRVVEYLAFLALVLLLIYGAMVYLLTRYGYLRRIGAFHARAEDEVRGEFARAWKVPSVAILVPSYKEEARTIEQTLFSAALQWYRNKRVVLLIDNPPDPDDPADRRRLDDARAVVVRVQGFFDSIHGNIESSFTEFLVRAHRGDLDPAREACAVAVTYVAAARRLDDEAREVSGGDHTDAFFSDRLLRGTAESLRERAEAIVGMRWTRELIELEYDRLLGLFGVEISSFERKRYVNLSHEANKAMNLNAYIDLMGRRVQEVGTDRGQMLVDVGGNASEGGVTIPDAKYVVTLDADSMILPHYIEHLVLEMEQPENSRIAVAQTPYSAIPHSTSFLERIAGATTDIQYQVHQGSSYFSAAFWVGANAVLRKRALEEISFASSERGFRIRKFIQDRTVIEDTESTIDLVERGWTIYNHPVRLAFSATPPDFGSILIQRRRWANGGLIILPKLVRHIFRKPFTRSLEGFVRVHYLISLAGVNTALLAIFAYPFDKSLHSIWLPMTALPYFILYGRDLVRAGYRFVDLFPVYAFNLMLIPIQLGGVVKSVQQALTGVKSPFGRTPKIAGRTAAPRFYIASELGLFAFLVFAGLMDLMLANWAHAAVAIVNAAFFFYAITAFMTWKASLEDLGLAGRPSTVAAAAASVSREVRPAHATAGFAGTGAVRKTSRYKRIRARARRGRQIHEDLAA